MSNRLHIEFGGTNLRYEVLDSQFGGVTSGSTSLVASGVSSLADFIDAQFMPGQISDVLVAAPSLALDGTIPNSGELQFQVRLPDGHTLASHCTILNDFIALAASADNIALLKPVDFHGKHVVFEPDRPVQFYFIGPGTGLGTAPAFFDPRDGKLVTAPSEIQHMHTAIYSKDDLKIFQQMAAARDGATADTTVCPLLTFEEICCGDGLARIFNALTAMDGSSTSDGPQDVIEYARHDNQIAKFAIGIWAKYLGITTNSMIKAHFQSSDQTDIAIVLGGGVIPKLINPDQQKDWGEAMRANGLNKIFYTHFYTGLNMPKTKNQKLDDAFGSRIMRAQIILPTCDNPGLVGLRSYAIRNRGPQFGNSPGFDANELSGP